MNEWEAIVLDLDGDAEMLDASLRSLVEQELPPRRIILLDNGSKSPTANRLHLRDDRIVLLREEENLGFAGGSNRAFRETTAELIAFINNDVVLDRGWSAVLIDALQHDPRAAAAQTILLDSSGLRVDGAGIALEHGRIEQLGHSQEPSAVDERRFWSVSATAAVYRREALQQVTRPNSSPFDEGYFAYYEDADLGARLQDAGWQMRLIAEAFGKHRGSATAARIGSSSEVLRTRNRYRFASAHPNHASVFALLLEDLRRLASSLLRLRMTRFAAIVRGMVAARRGWSGPPADI